MKHLASTMRIPDLRCIVWLFLGTVLFFIGLDHLWGLPEKAASNHEIRLRRIGPERVCPVVFVLICILMVILCYDFFPDVQLIRSFSCKFRFLLVWMCQFYQCTLSTTHPDITSLQAIQVWGLEGLTHSL